MTFLRLTASSSSGSRSLFQSLKTKVESSLILVAEMFFSGFKQKKGLKANTYTILVLYINRIIGIQQGKLSVAISQINNYNPDIIFIELPEDMVRQH